MRHKTGTSEIPIPISFCGYNARDFLEAFSLGLDNHGKEHLPSKDAVTILRGLWKLWANTQNVQIKDSASLRKATTYNTVAHFTFSSSLTIRVALTKYRCSFQKGTGSPGSRSSSKGQGCSIQSTRLNMNRIQSRTSQKVQRAASVETSPPKK